MVIKYLGYIVLIALAILLTFFGIGPVLFADGSMKERLLTLLVVLVCYALVGIGFYYWNHKMSGKADKE